MNASIGYLLYAGICFFPFMLFAYYPLRYFKRFNTKTMFAIELAISIPEIIFFLFGFKDFSDYAILLISLIVLFNIFAYKLLYKINYGRILFNLLLIVNVANFTVVFAKFLAIILFPHTADFNFYWTNSICVLITEVVFVLPIFFFVKHFSDSMIRNSSYDYIWRVAWFVPLILSTVGFIMIYGPNIYASSQIELCAKKSLLCAMLVLCLLFIYSFIAKLIQTQDDVLKLEKDLYHQSLQQVQYDKIEKAIKDTRVIRHDLRHHIALMCNYVDQEEYEKLKDYLHQYSQTIQQISQLHYTNHSVLNTLLVYYADLCRTSHIAFDAKLALPESMNLQDNEVTIIFSNLLENAYQACLEMESQAPSYIQIQATTKANHYIFVITNTYLNTLAQDSTGNFLTTKSTGSGIGLVSVKEIIEKYNGFLKIETDNQLFKVSISIPDNNALVF